MTGQMIGNYRVVAKLGEGGMGKVYRAVDTMLEREAALKSLKPEIAAQPGIVERFRSEAVLLAKLNHPAVALLYTFFKDGDQYFMAMEYVAGDTLEALIHKNGAIPYPRALAYTTQILQGIGHAHSMGILHRDLKPANIMLTPAEKVKIMDFGIARVLGSAGMTRDGRVIGTLEYLAPERIRGKQDDPRSDLYSVGVVLYQMLTGRLPFEADSDYDLLTAQIQQQPPRPRDIGVGLPPEVENLLMTALEKDPDRRYADAAAFEAAIAAFLESTRSPKAGSKAGGMETRSVAPIPGTPAAAGPDSQGARLTAGPAAETRLTAAPEVHADAAASRPTVVVPAPAGETRLTAAPEAHADAAASRPTVVVPALAAETRLTAGPEAHADAAASRPTVATPSPAAPTVVAPVPARGPDTPVSPVTVGRMAKLRPLLSDKRAAAVVGALGLVLLVGIGWVVYRHMASFHAQQTKLAATPPAPAHVLPAQPVQPIVDTGAGTGTGGNAAPSPTVQDGGSPSPIGPGPKPAPAPDQKSQQDSGKPKQPPAPPPTETPLPAVTPEVRRAALAALDQTDGPAAGDPGSRPIQLTGLLAALKAGGPSMAADIEEAVARRGVSFQLTAALSDALRTAGAPDPLVTLVEMSYREKADTAAANGANAPAPKVVKPAPRIAKLGDVKSLFVDCAQDEMSKAVRDEVKKQLGAKIKLMDVQTGADAVMKVTLTGPNGGAVTRALGLKDRAQVNATVVDAATGASLWQQGAGDRKPIIGIFQGESLKRLAERIVKDLKDAISKK